jgi:hypothetical protein
MYSPSLVLNFDRNCDNWQQKPSLDAPAMTAASAEPSPPHRSSLTPLGTFFMLLCLPWLSSYQLTISFAASLSAVLPLLLICIFCARCCAAMPKRKSTESPLTPTSESRNGKKAKVAQAGSTSDTMSGSSLRNKKSKKSRRDSSRHARCSFVYTMKQIH